MYTVIFMTQAQKDAKKIAATGLKEKALDLINLIQKEPYKYPPEYECLKGNMQGLISRIINKQHRLVYEVVGKEKIIKIYRMWTHYE